MADSRQLTGDEARVLLGLETLPDPQRFGAWVLRSKDVHHLRLGASALSDLLWDDVDLSDVHWSGATLARAQIQNSRFTDVSFAGCAFQDVLFVDCDLTNLQAGDVQFRRCRFERCVFGNLNAPGTRFSDCTFEHARLLGADLREVTLERCAFRGCDFEFVRAARGKLIACALTEGSMRNCRFSYCDSQDLGFEDVEFEQTLFVGGEHAAWRMERVRGSVLKLISVQLRSLRVSGCSELTGLRLITSNVHDVQLDQNPRLLSFLIYRSEITALHVSDTVLLYSSFDEAKIGPSSVYEAVSFEGLRISDSELTRAQFMHCRFSDYFYLHRSQFHSLVADDLRYDAGLREIHEAVTYPNTAAHLGSRP